MADHLNKADPGRGGETADALRSGRSVHYGRVGSNPSLGTTDRTYSQREFLKGISELRGRCKRLATTDNALVAQRIERCPAEAEAESSNLSKRTTFQV